MKESGQEMTKGRDRTGQDMTGQVGQTKGSKKQITQDFTNKIGQERLE